MIFNRYFWLLILVFGFVSCTSKEFQSRTDSITIMTFNVENLFDTLDDPAKSDETYLPLKLKSTGQHRRLCNGLGKPWYKEECLKMDWSEELLEKKLLRMASVILQIKNGQGPDILVLQEVENLNVVERLRKNHLQAAGYKETILIEGPDERGIDVALLSRLPVTGQPILHHFKRTHKDRELSEDEILITGSALSRYLEAKASSKKVKTYSNQKPNRNSLKKMNKTRSKEEKVLGEEIFPTRGILQAQFLLPDQKNLTLLAVHFPSQGAPSHHRRAGLIALSALKKKLSPDDLVIAAGDFNITAAEENKQKFFSERAAKDWLISHHLGCEKCQGTHNYQGEWSFLDVMLFSKNFNQSPWQIQKESIRLANKSIFQVDHNGSPARFNNGLGQKGVSDHWPLAVDLIRVEAPSRD